MLQHMQDFLARCRQCKTRTKSRVFLIGIVPLMGTSYLIVGNAGAAVAGFAWVGICMHLFLNDTPKSR